MSFGQFCFYWAGAWIIFQGCRVLLAILLRLATNPNE